MVKIVFLTLVIIMAGIASPVDAKKTLPIEKESPPSETEIICFAAKEKWVCAPASDQQQAKDKAMRLIEEKSKQEKVIINTIPSGTGLKEVVVEEPVNSEPLTAAKPQNMVSGDFKEKKVDVVTTTQVVPDQEVQDASSTGLQQSNVFSDWQSDHSNQWTLQAVGTTNLPNLERFISDNNLVNETMSIATTEIKGAPWHIVLVGLFNDREQALAFKEAAQNNGSTWASSAWPRPVNGINIIK